jgi:putative GTP pyrophosphokinase
MEQPRSPEDWRDAFEEARPTYVAFCERVRELLESALGEMGLAYYSVYSRVDYTEWFVERVYMAARDGLPVDDPFEDLPRFACVEITTYSLNDLEQVEALVHAELEVDANASTSLAATAAAANQPSPHPDTGWFGYEVIELVASVPSSRATLWRGFDGLRLVIVVQTLVQRAWAEFDQHVLPYFRHSSRPASVRGAIETAVARCIDADRAVEEVRREIWRLDGEYREAISEGTVDLPLDAQSLRAYVEGSQRCAELAAVAVAAGMEPGEDYRADDWALEQRLLWVLARAGIESIAELDALLLRSQDRITQLLGDLTAISLERGFRPYAVPDDLVAFGLLVLTRADAGTVMLVNYHEDLEYALNTLIGNPVGRDDQED